MLRNSEENSTQVSSRTSPFANCIALREVLERSVKSAEAKSTSTLNMNTCKPESILNWAIYAQKLNEINPCQNDDAIKDSYKKLKNITCTVLFAKCFCWSCRYDSKQGLAKCFENVGRTNDITLFQFHDCYHISLFVHPRIFKSALWKLSSSSEQSCNAYTVPILSNLFVEQNLIVKRWEMRCLELSNFLILRSMNTVGNINKF